MAKLFRRSTRGQNKRRHTKSTRPHARKTRKTRKSRKSRKTRRAPRRAHRRYKRARSLRGGSGSGSTAPVSMMGPSSWIPSDITNMSRSMTSGMGNTMNAINGVSADASPLPYKGQLDSGITISEILRTA